MSGGIVINGKFLGAPLNGVHRTAALYTGALMAEAERHGVPVRLLAPRPAEGPLRPEVAPGIFGAGQGWEMLTLPRLARGALLVNFCNLAPLLHRNSVVMIHDAQTFLYPEDYTGRQAAAYRRLLPLIGRRARRVLTVSGFARESLVAHGIATAEKTEVVHNGTDHLLATPADAEALSRLGLAPGNYILALGSTKGYKNIPRLFEALAEPLPGFRLVVAGGPREEAYRARGWTPPPGTLFTGFIEDATLRALYEGARVFAFPSRTEGFGLPPIEAMHCGAPVVAARAGAMPEVCGDAALLVEPDDTQGWRAALAALAEGPERQARISAGHARGAELTWQAAGKRLWACLEPLL